MSCEKQDIGILSCLKEKLHRFKKLRSQTPFPSQETNYFLLLYDFLIQQKEAPALGLPSSNSNITTSLQPLNSNNDKLKR